MSRSITGDQKKELQEVNAEPVLLCEVIYISSGITVYNWSTRAVTFGASTYEERLFPSGVDGAEVRYSLDTPLYWGFAPEQSFRLEIVNTDDLFDTVVALGDTVYYRFLRGNIDADYGDFTEIGHFMLGGDSDTDGGGYVTAVLTLNPYNPLTKNRVNTRRVSDEYPSATLNADKIIPLTAGSFQVTGLSDDQINSVLRLEISSASGDFTSGETIYIKDGAAVIGTAVLKGLSIDGSNDFVELTSVSAINDNCDNILGLTSGETADIDAITYVGYPVDNNVGSSGQLLPVAKAINIGNNEYLLNGYESKDIRGLFSYKADIKTYMRRGRDGYVRWTMRDHDYYITDDPAEVGVVNAPVYYEYFHLDLAPGQPLPPSPWWYLIGDGTVDDPFEVVKAEIDYSHFQESTGRYFVNFKMLSRGLFGTGIQRHPASGYPSAYPVGISALQYVVLNPDENGNTLIKSLPAVDEVVNLDTLDNSEDFTNPGNAFDGAVDTYARIEFTGDVLNDGYSARANYISGFPFSDGDTLDIRATSNPGDPVTGTIFVNDMPTNYLIFFRVLTGSVSNGDYIHNSGSTIVAVISTLTETQNGGFLTGYKDSTKPIPAFNRIVAMVRLAIDFAGLSLGGVWAKSAGAYAWTPSEDQFNTRVSSIGGETEQNVTNPEYAFNANPAEYAEMTVSGSNQTSLLIGKISSGNIAERYHALFLKISMQMVKTIGDYLSGDVTTAITTGLAGSASSSDFSNPSYAVDGADSEATASMTSSAVSLTVSSFSAYKPTGCIGAMMTLKAEVDLDTDDGLVFEQKTVYPSTGVASGSTGFTNTSNFFDKNSTTYAYSTENDYETNHIYWWSWEKSGGSSPDALGDVVSAWFKLYYQALKPAPYSSNPETLDYFDQLDSTPSGSWANTANMVDGNTANFGTITLDVSNTSGQADFEWSTSANFANKYEQLFIRVLVDTEADILNNNIQVFLSLNRSADGSSWTGSDQLSLSFMKFASSSTIWLYFDVTQQHDFVLGSTYAGCSMYFYRVGSGTYTLDIAKVEPVAVHNTDGVLKGYIATTDAPGVYATFPILYDDSATDTVYIPADWYINSGITGTKKGSVGFFREGRIGEVRFFDLQLIYTELSLVDRRIQGYITADENLGTTEHMPFEVIADGTEREYQIDVTALIENLPTSQSLDAMILNFLPLGSGGTVTIKVDEFRKIRYIAVSDTLSLVDSRIQLDARIYDGTSWSDYATVASMLPQSAKDDVKVDLMPVFNPEPGADISNYYVQLRLQKNTAFSDNWTNRVHDIYLESIAAPDQTNPPTVGDGLIQVLARINDSEQRPAPIINYDIVDKTFFIDLTDAFFNRYRMTDLIGMTLADLKLRVDIHGYGAIENTTVDIYEKDVMLVGVPGESNDDLYLDCQGIKDDSSGTFTGSASAVVEKATDVALWVLNQMADLDLSDDVDKTSFTDLRDSNRRLAFQLWDEISPKELLNWIIFHNSSIGRVNDERKISLLEPAGGASVYTFTESNIKRGSYRTRPTPVNQRYDVIKYQHSADAATGKHQLASSGTGDRTYQVKQPLFMNNSTYISDLVSAISTLLTTAQDREYFAAAIDSIDAEIGDEVTGLNSGASIVLSQIIRLLEPFASETVIESI